MIANRLDVGARDPSDSANENEIWLTFVQERVIFTWFRRTYCYHHKIPDRNSATSICHSAKRAMFFFQLNVQSPLDAITIATSGSSVDRTKRNTNTNEMIDTES